MRCVALDGTFQRIALNLNTRRVFPGLQSAQQRTPRTHARTARAPLLPRLERELNGGASQAHGRRGVRSFQSRCHPFNSQPSFDSSPWVD